MSTCPWGIANGFGDTLGHWHDTPHDTRQAILAAMGVTDSQSGPNGPDPVRVVRAGQSVDWPQAGRLLLEDGGQLRLAGRLPPDLPLGYHQFQPDADQPAMRIIVSPQECVVPPRRMWGFAAQLYAARSQSSWGMGDLADLERLTAWSAQLGAGLVMVNPLAASAPRVPQEPSPYYPSSRLFLNPLYLRVENVPGAAELGAELEELVAAGRALNADRHIDRDAVWALKRRALEALWRRFSGDPAFEAFCRERGDALRQFAAYCALAGSLGHDWRKWPAEYRDCRSAAVAAFVEQNADRVRFEQWLQWLLDQQLEQASQSATLIQDLPVGVDPGGADAWAWQSLLTQNCTVGAPPDAFNAHGQDWQVPAFVPHKLRTSGYEPFAQTLRAQLRHAGGLRIDHVMGLFRLFWIPQGFGPPRGAYVRYRADELLAVVALESHRAGAFIVGEDLGTVEHGVRENLAEHRVLCFRVMWFEPRPPAEYPPLAMAALTTHDLPTVAGLWTESDLAEQKRLGFHADDAMRSMRGHLAHMAGVADGAAVEQVIERAHARLAEAPSQLLVATLEDALAVPDRPNMPGTITERTNWATALPGGLEALEQSGPHGLPTRIAKALSRS